MFLPRFLVSPLVWEIWILIAQELSFLCLLIGRSIGRLWDRLGDLEFARALDQEIVRATRSLIWIP